MLDCICLQADIQTNLVEENVYSFSRRKKTYGHWYAHLLRKSVIRSFCFQLKNELMLPVHFEEPVQREHIILTLSIRRTMFY